MELMLARCTIRRWQREDVPSLARHANNRKIWMNLRDTFPYPYTLEDGQRWVESCIADPLKPNFAIAVHEQAAGGIGLRPGTDVYRRSAEIGFWLGEEFWGRGIMTEALTAMTAHAFSRYGLGRIFACVFEWNKATMRVLEKAGYEREGVLRKSAIKDGRSIDTVLYAIVKEQDP